METNISNQSTNGIVGNYASDYISQAFSYPSNTIGGIAQTSRHSGIRGLGAGVQVFGNTLGGSIGKGVYDSILNNGLSTKSIGQGFSTGFKNAFDFKGGWTSAGAGLGMNAAGAILSAVGGPKQEYSGEKGSVTQGLDTAYDVVQTAAGFIPGVGTLVSGLMSLNKGLTGVLNKWGGGTDAMTDVDAVLGSNWFGPIGSVNGFTGKKAHTMDGKDFMTQEQLGNMWAGYGDTYYNYQDALTKEGKKYGGLSSGARRRANRIIDKANMDKEYLLDMNRGYELGNIRGNNMSGINSTAYNIALSGGFKPISIGRQGFKISSLKEAISSIDRTPKSSTIVPWKPTEEEIEMFQKGGNFKLIPYSEWKKGIDFQINDDYDLETAYNELPIEELEQWKKSKGQSHLSSKYKKDNHPTYSDPGYGWFGSDEIGWTFYPSPRQMQNRSFDEYVEYWKRAEPNSTLNYGGRTYVNTPIAYHKEGGSMNVIPEGSLHARLHHMEDADGLTKKGIPVVDNEGNQQAEIELNEIIFRKEVTDKLEELAKDGSNKAAEEAGRLLVEEIFENTDDRTGLIKDVTGEVEKIPTGQGGLKFIWAKNKVNDLLSTLQKQESTEQKAIAEQAAKDIANQGSNAIEAKNFFTQLNNAADKITGTVFQIGTEQKNKELQRKANIDQQLADAKQREQERLAIKNTGELASLAANKERADLYAQKYAMSAQEGDKLPELDTKNIISQLLSLPPEKLKELQNILNYLNNG